MLPDKSQCFMNNVKMILECLRMTTIPILDSFASNLLQITSITLRADEVDQMACIGVREGVTPV